MQPTIITLPRHFVGVPQRANRKRIRWSSTTAVIEAVLLVALIGWFDYWTGDFAMTLFYFGPVALATWCVGQRAGWSIALLSALTWLISDLALHDHERTRALPYLNAAMLLLVCGTIAELILSIRRAHDRLRARLELRTVSLAEVHHRVKNNLQIVSSLLLLQSDKFADPAVRVVFTECRDRLNTMARLHEQLYAEAGSAQVNFATHLRELAEMLVRSHRPPRCKLTLDVRADCVPLDLDRGILLSLIATELILNPLKHAFDGRVGGKLEVGLRSSAQRIALTIRDDGTGFAREQQTDDDHPSLGLDLVAAMSRQLGGDVTIGNDPRGGTRAAISFPTKPARKSRDLIATSTSIEYAENSYSDRRRRSADSLCA
jgi:two-component sensor histidine kinase